MAIVHNANTPIIGLSSCYDPSNIKSYNPAQNLITYSTYNGTAWASSTIHSTVATGFDAPDGTNTAVRVTCAPTGTTLFRVFNQFFVANGTDTYTASFYARLISGDVSGGIPADLNDGSPFTNDYGSQLVLNKWVRISITGVPVAGNKTFFDLISDRTLNIVIDFWGLEVEQNTKVSTYTPTTGTAITRTTTVTDLRTASTSSLVGGVLYDGEAGGIFKFDGVDDYLNFTAPGLGNVATIEVWAKMKNLSPAGDGTMIAGWGNYDIWVKDNSIGFNTFNGDRYGMASSVINTLGITNNWKHFIFEMRSDLPYTNNKIYVNGVSQTLSQILNSEAPSNRNFNAGNGRISGTLGVAGYSSLMDLGLFKVYNRVLTQEEILSNFNASRGRFGV